MTSLLNKNIKMLVCDMAGTTVNEKGLIYKCMKTVITDLGYDVPKTSIKEWYGRDKTEVLKSYLSDKPKYHLQEAENMLMKRLEKEYFKGGNIHVMHPKLANFFNMLRMNDIKIALNTGYPPKFQRKIINHLGLNYSIDDYISSQDVERGRPYPYMIHELARRHKIKNPKHIAKIGDTVPDMLEGRNSHCGLVIGVLSGAETHENLARYSDFNVDSIIDLNDCFKL